MVKDFVGFSDDRKKLWINEFPICPLAGKNHFEIKKHANSKRKPLLYRLAAEISLSTHNNGYGFLGIEFVPDMTSKNIVFKVLYCEEKEKKVVSEILSNSYNTIYWGLPLEYAEAVFDQGAKYFDLSNFGPGMLICAIGAYCDVRSSKNVFRKLTNFLLLHMLEGDVSENDLRNL